MTEARPPTPPDPPPVVSSGRSPGGPVSPPAIPPNDPSRGGTAPAGDAPPRRTFRGLVLDAFQVQAIDEIEAGRSLVLAAPTGSGKTLVAEYLIEKFLQSGRRIIYTSPIKALSNQKYRDFSAQYPDRIGILTGDVVINREAPVLIMTTEVYRNMALEDPDVIRDVAYVIFDEIHFLGDIERGTVWEESIIFAPPGMRFLALSATIPNAEELATWIGTVSEQRVGVITHDRRAVPLKFQFFHQGSLWHFKELDRRLRGRAAGDSAPPDADAGRRRRRRRSEEGQRWQEVIGQLAARQQLPVLYFCFSRALVDRLAGEAIGVFDFTTPEQKQEISALAADVIARYRLEGLDSAVNLARELEHGIGRHHAGLLPQLKELVEILFSRRLLSVLFVTETFAVGVNMPARSVAFDALKKYDGRSFRPMKTLEFFQLAGRAGRRGIDPVGYVVVPHLPRDLEWEELANVVHGQVETLRSQFDLSFNSVLNLYRQHPFGEVRKILKRNFAQFQANQHVPELARRVADLRLELEQAMPPCDEPERDLEAFSAFLERKRQILDAGRQQLGQTRRGMRGRRQRQAMGQLKADLQARLEELETEQQKFFCGRCRRRGQCQHRVLRALKVKRRLELAKTQLDQVTELQLPLYEEKIRQMRQLGYVDSSGVLPRGEFASRIHTEEITVTELYFEGFFHEADWHELNALLMAVVYEHRKNTVVVPPPAGPALDLLRRARGCIRAVSLRYPFVRPLDIRLSMVMYSWSRGARFEEVLAQTDIPEGDLIRSFRQAIDLGRQVREATDDRDLKAKLGRCIDMINRDIVLATELRD